MRKPAATSFLILLDLVAVAASPPRHAFYLRRRSCPAQLGFEPMGSSARSPATTAAFSHGDSVRGVGGDDLGGVLSSGR